MNLVIFSKTHPEGVAADASSVTHYVTDAIEAKGVYRGGCPCCNKPIVVRADDGGAARMTAGDEHFLLHDGGPA